MIKKYNKGDIVCIYENLEPEPLATIDPALLGDSLYGFGRVKTTRKKKLKLEIIMVITNKEWFVNNNSRFTGILKVGNISWWNTHNILPLVSKENADRYKKDLKSLLVLARLRYVDLKFE